MTILELRERNGGELGLRAREAGLPQIQKVNLVASHRLAGAEEGRDRKEVKRS